MNAVQVALALPEILSNIFGFIDMDREKKWEDFDAETKDDRISGRTVVLAKCGRVNKVWFAESVRYLWTQPVQILFERTLSNLTKTFRSIAPDRRQFYANFIETALLVTVDKEEANIHDDAVRGVRFPKLHFLQVVISDTVLNKDMHHVPKIQGPGITFMIVGVQSKEVQRRDTFRVTRRGMDSVLEAIPGVAPNVTQVIFSDFVSVSLKALKQFEKRLPHMRRSYNYWDMRVIDVDDDDDDAETRD